MKLFHLSDLHIGKMLHMYDMSDIQRDVFGQIINSANKTSMIKRHLQEMRLICSMTF